MEHSIAFKTNSKVATTTIVNGYISIGRSGKATPMIKVQPCDLNETVVTDISLSNFNKVKKLDLHENDTIVVESSGDVIPMVKEVVKQGSAIELTFDLKCPICGYNLVPYVAGNGITEYECRNQSCPRLISGKITNFLDKLGAKNISDQTILNIYESLNLRDIIDFLDTNKYKSELMALPDWGAQSANNFCIISKLGTISFCNKESALSATVSSVKKSFPNNSCELFKELEDDIESDIFRSNAYGVLSIIIPP
jgi:DNA ligase (NAD+)